MKLLLCFCAFAMMMLSSSCGNKITTGTEASPIQETFAVDFRNGTQGVSTRNTYSGPIAIQVEGIGQASGSSWSDAFYIYTDYNGSVIEPWHPTEYYNWTLWINGEPADTLVSSIPKYSSDHVYVFVINAPGGRLRFSVGDAGADDNAGSYIVSILE